jgi:hypothetical protein
MTAGAALFATPDPRATGPGRTCPPQYAHPPRLLARAPVHAAEVAYVIGGLYGNPLALDAIAALAAAERVRPLQVFNGDFHWFDADPALFAAVEARVRDAGHLVLRGNVETELASPVDTDVGCGCAYPAEVPDADVARSNAILARLRTVAAPLRERAAWDALPMTAVLGVGPLRVGVVHGDAWSLAGWRFAHDALHAAGPADGDDGPRGASLHDTRLAGAFAQAAVDGWACSHTCAPALKVTADGFVINNGAAGMGNFAGQPHGVITRIGTRALPAALAAQRLYGLHLRGVWVDALRVDFDLPAWLARFDALWPAGSPAAVSYRRRIVDGPPFSIDAALGRLAAACLPQPPA